MLHVPPILPSLIFLPLQYLVPQLVEALLLLQAGSIPDVVIGIFHCHNPSGPTMTLVLTQPLTEVCTRKISLGLKETGA